MKTRYLPVKYRHMVEDQFPSAGPKPCIKGMKDKYYGRDSYCVMCGQFLYNLGKELNPSTRRIYELAH